MDRDPVTREAGRLRWIGSLLASAVLLSSQPAAAQPRPLTPEDIVSFKAVVSLAVSPDARAAVVALRSAHHDEHRFETDLWLVPLDGVPARQLTFARGSEDAPAWSPDGSRIAFLARRGELVEVHVLPLAGGEGRPYASGRGSVASFAWAPDGKRLALVGPADDTEQDARRRHERDDAFVVGEQWRNHRVWIATEGSVPRAITDGKRHVRAVRWSPDGKQLAIVTTLTPEADSSEDSRAEIVELDTGRARQVPDSAQASNVVWSPDGGMLLIVRPFDGRGISREDAFVWPLGGDRVVNVTRQLDRDVEEVFWRDQARIEVLYSLGTVSALSTIDVRTSTIVDTWAPGIAVSELRPAGASWALVAGDRPDELLVRAGETLKTLTRWNAELASSLELPVAETVKWRSGAGPLEGVLVRPAQLAADRRYPVIVNPHGGPRSHSMARFDPVSAYFVSQGYLVLKPNFRGSTGYGDIFARANVANWGEGPHRDLISGVESLVVRGLADPARLFIYGWSYGGYLTNWAVTHGDHFRAAASGAGVADLRMQYSISDARRWRFDYFTGTPFTGVNMPVYERESPVTYARFARTPTLFLHGENDVRCPPAQSLMMYRALQDNGVKTDLVMYPREGHGFAEPRHISDRARRVVEWFRAHDPAAAPQRRTTTG
ncbi:MAG TPA: S9 family peptidase [Vicinamibacterales bacterium]|nr:S9 family peptidase [Vicinamibacterales bacterium]